MEEGRWVAEKVKGMKGTPWEPTPGRNGDMEVRPRILMREEGEAITEGLKVKDPSMPYRGRIYKNEVLKYGMTPDCPGFKAINK